MTGLMHQPQSLRVDFNKLCEQEILVDKYSRSTNLPSLIHLQRVIKGQLSILANIDVS